MNTNVRYTASPFLFLHHSFSFILSSVLPPLSWSHSQVSVRTTGSPSSVHALAHRLVATLFTVWTPSLLPTLLPLQLPPPPRPSSQISQIWFSQPPQSPAPLLTPQLRPHLPRLGKMGLKTSFWLIRCLCCLSATGGSNGLSFKGKVELRLPLERKKNRGIKNVFFLSQQNHDSCWCSSRSLIARLLSLPAFCFLLKATYNLLFSRSAT